MNHDGHRNRIRKKFIEGAVLEDHEILEILLFSSIPRANTNELAHELIRHCGSLRGVFDTDLEGLQAVKGIGAASAFQIRLVSECIARYMLGATDTRKLLDHSDALRDYLKTLFIGCNYEKSMVLFFNAAGRLLSTEEIGRGFVSGVAVSVRKVLSLATKVNAVAAVLVHNHPDGIALPSEQDLAATLRMEEALRSVDVTLINHFVVAGGECRPILYHSDHKDDLYP